MEGEIKPYTCPPKLLHSDDHPEITFQPPCDQLDNLVITLLKQVKETKKTPPGGLKFMTTEWYESYSWIMCPKAITSYSS